MYVTNVHIARQTVESTPFATEPLEKHSSLLLLVTQSTAHKDSEVHDTAHCVGGTVTLTAKQAVYGNCLCE